MSVYSEEQLLLPRTHAAHAHLVLTQVRERDRYNLRIRSMAPTEAIVIERKISHGIGGAGNIRKTLILSSIWGTCP